MFLGELVVVENWMVLIQEESYSTLKKLLENALEGGLEAGDHESDVRISIRRKFKMAEPS